ncbi:caspase-2-like [Styela clava]
MPFMQEITPEFEKFCCDLGLRKETAHEMWDADIHSPQELAAMEISELKKFSSNSLLLNNIHPILQKYVFNITTAKDPYKMSLKIIRKQAQAMELEEDEPMDAADSTTVADSTAFTDKTEELNGRTGGKANLQLNNAGRTGGVRYNNNGTSLNNRGANCVQSNIGLKGNGTGKGHSITITGGNFTQSSVLSSGPVTYNNTNTTITTTVNSESEADIKKRRSKLLGSTLFLDGTQVKTADIGWMDNHNFWVDKIRLPTAEYEQYTEHLNCDDVYHIRSNGRALILNNIEFSAASRMKKRTGADADCKRMEQLLSELGFKVRAERNKTAAEMKTILKDFAQSRDNRSTGISVIYIGSHGERDERGNDTFVGSDGGRVNFREVQDMFSPKNSPLLNNIPKVFFLQFCRQEGPTIRTPAAAPLQTASVMSDAGWFDTHTEKPVANLRASEVDPSEETRLMDMLCVYATLTGTKAYRDTADGSWFVTALIRVFQENAHKDDVLSMLTKVNNSVSLNNGNEGSRRALQVSEVCSSLRKKLYFYPGQLA